MRRTALLLAFLVACGGHGSHSTLPKPSASPPIKPASDLADARANAPRADPGDKGLTARDPRVIDLDIIRIRASGSGIGGDPELTSVASADLFKQANASAKAGTTKDAIARYRQLISEFPDSQYAPVSLFNIAAVYDHQGDLPNTITTLEELLKSYPQSRESIDGHLYIAALQADHHLWPQAVATLDAALARTSLTYADRVEAFARKGYVEMEQQHFELADTALEASVAEWRKAPRIEDPYYIAMAHYYRGELMHRKFAAAQVRTGDDEMVADLEAKRVLAVKAYDRWKESLGFRHAYWATASGYQMSQIFVELWEAHVKAPYPKRIDAQTRPKYVADVHDRVREHLEKALEGHRMNVELAHAFGVDTQWSKGSEQRAVQILELIAKESKGSYVTP
ncbi:MAG: tetratricopeptide repeat protein [Myxococcales bacterium]|nr:tetratricopeptide repeat protein [Myxococcales bacterium]